MQYIKSKENSFIKHIKKLKEKKYRDSYSEFVIEGIKLVKEAIQENAVIKNIIINENFNSDIKNLENYNCICVPNNIFSLISNVSTPQGIMAIVEKPIYNDINFDNEIILILDDVQDPGNLGTILRIADSIGLKQIIVSKDTADIYNPKVVRSTMGAIFRVEILQSQNLIKTVESLHEHGYKTIVTTPVANKTIYDINYKKSAIIVGNESNGVHQNIIDIANEKVKIPMPRKC